MSRSRQPREGKSCGQQRFEVFDFGEEDERVEETSEKIVGKFGNPRKRRKRGFSSPITKYSFLQCFASTRDQELQQHNEPIEIDDEPIDVGTEASIKTVRKGSADLKAYEPIDIDDGHVDVNTGGGSKILQKGICDGLDIASDNLGQQCKYSVSTPGFTQKENGFVKEDISDLDIRALSSSSNYKNKRSGTVANDDDTVEMSTSTTSISMPVEVPLEDQLQQHGFMGCEIDSSSTKVVVFADFIIYGDKYSTNSCVTFSSGSIRVECSTRNGTWGSFKTEWTISDIINIKSEWCEMVKTAMVSIQIKSKVPKEFGDVNLISGVDKLKLSVCNPRWFEEEEAIKSLDVRYRNLWNVTYSSEPNDENALFGCCDGIMSPLYNSDHDGTFEDIIYPTGDPDAVLIRKNDVELLQPECFINDTIIDFYIKYLKHKIQPEDHDRFFFFNSFFFRKLADLDKDPSSACNGEAAFQRVHKWTRKIDLFMRDYIFIPVNYSLHWSLIIICHPGEVEKFRDDEVGELNRVPCILHMDSIRGSHKGLKNLIRRYLFEEWKERHKETMDAVSSKFLNLRFVSLELPQQENSFDCGLFLLHYLELFLEEAPTNFSPFKITKCSNFLNSNWFSPVEASMKRASIRKLIYHILEEQRPKVPPDSTDNCFSFHLHDTNEQVGMDFSKERQSVSKDCRGYSSSTKSEPGIGCSLSFSSPLMSAQQLIAPGLSLREFSDLEICSSYSGTSSKVRANQSRIFLSPLWEAEGVCEQMSDSSSKPEKYRLISGSANGFPTSCFGEELMYLGSSSRKEECIQLEELNEDSRITCTSGSQKSSEIGLDDDDPHPDSVGASERMNQQILSTQCEDIAEYVVEDSLDSIADCVVAVSEEEEEESCLKNSSNIDRDSASFLGKGNILSSQIDRPALPGIIVIGDDMQTDKKAAAEGDSSNSV